MPTYDYQCDACDHKFELYQGINDEKKKKCPECGKLKLRRLIGTGAAIVFKGSGFYQTDYRSDSYHKAKAADKPSESKSEGGKSEDGKSEGGKSEGGKSEGGRSEGGRSEGGRSERGRSEGGKSSESKSSGSDSRSGGSGKSSRKASGGSSAPSE